MQLSLRTLALLGGSLVALLSGCDETLGNSCGGLQGKGCNVGQFCSYDLSAQCGAADQTGLCEKVPTACDTLYAPVCGCNDKTYGNSCEANMAGVSVAKQGACETASEDGGQSSDASTRDASASHDAAQTDASTPPPGKTCAGFAALQCEAGQFCSFEDETGVGCGNLYPDQAGTCQTQPQACTEQYDPVCGCDGKTHGNACAAHSAGVSIASKGECKPAGKISCDHRNVLCKAAEPKCPEFQVASVEGSCWGPCVKIDECVCNEADQCPHRETFVCHMSKQRCGPYVN